MKLGKKVSAPKTADIRYEADRIIGQTWTLERVDRRVIYEFVSGGLSGSVKRHEVSEEDYAAVRAGTMTDYDLLLKYDLS